MLIKIIFKIQHMNTNCWPPNSTLQQFIGLNQKGEKSKSQTNMSGKVEACDNWSIELNFTLLTQLIPEE